MSDRFFAPVPFDQPTVELTGPEAHHLAHVLRKRPGDTVVLFDGRGTEATAEITAVSKRGVELCVRETRGGAGEARRPIVLGTAVPKGDRFRWLVEKATELGVVRLVPLQTERSVVDPGVGKLEKMRQTVIAACKQSGRSRLMEIGPPTAWEAFVAGEFPGQSAFVAHRRSESLRSATAELRDDQAVVLAVGSEGGFTDREIELAEAGGGRIVSLGPRILRTETAAVALAAWFGASG